jgi:hypothetical protein
MNTRPPQARATTVRLYAVGAIFLVPLSIGVLLVNNSASLNAHANEISRDVASMYAQGIDFSKPANRDIVLRAAEGMGVNIEQGHGVLILSKIRVVHDSDCPSEQTANCTNKGYAVITQRYVIGNPELRASSFGTPGKVDAATGNVRNWTGDISARAEDFTTRLSPGESTYAAECYLTAPEARTGVYSRSMF